MEAPPDGEGIGTASADHPAFSAPAGAPPRSLSPGGPWAPPDPEGRMDAPPPSGRGPGHDRRSRRTAIAALVIGGLLLASALSALPVLSPSVPQAQDTSAPTLVTASPTPVATAASTVTGGGIGERVEFAGPEGSGTLVVTRAVWTDEGPASPPAGRRYLVLDVTVECTKGRVPLSPVFLRVDSGSAKVLPGFGPALERPLGGVVLDAGRQSAGQVGYVLAPAAARVSLLDENLHPLGSVEIPAP